MLTIKESIELKNLKNEVKSLKALLKSYEVEFEQAILKSEKWHKDGRYYLSLDRMNYIKQLKSRALKKINNTNNRIQKNYKRIEELQYKQGFDWTVLQ